MAAARKPADSDRADLALGRALRRVLKTMRGSNERADLAADRKARSALGRDIKHDKGEIGKRTRPRGRK